MLWAVFMKVMWWVELRRGDSTHISVVFDGVRYKTCSVFLSFLVFWVLSWGSLQTINGAYLRGGVGTMPAKSTATTVSMAPSEPRYFT